MNWVAGLSTYSSCVPRCGILQLLATRAPRVQLRDQVYRALMEELGTEVKAFEGVDNGENIRWS